MTNLDQMTTKLDTLLKAGYKGRGKRTGTPGNYKYDYGAGGGKPAAKEKKFDSTKPQSVEKMDKTKSSNWAAILKNAPDSFIKDVIGEWRRLKERWNKGEINISQKEKKTIIALSEALESPEFSKYKGALKLGKATTVENSWLISLLKADLR